MDQSHRFVSRLNITTTVSLFIPLKLTFTQMREKTERKKAAGSNMSFVTEKVKWRTRREPA